MVSKKCWKNLKIHGNQHQNLSKSEPIQDQNQHHLFNIELRTLYGLPKASLNSVFLGGVNVNPQFSDIQKILVVKHMNSIIYIHIIYRHMYILYYQYIPFKRIEYGHVYIRIYHIRNDSNYRM